MHSYISISKLMVTLSISSKRSLYLGSKLVLQIGF